MSRISPSTLNAARVPHEGDKMEAKHTPGPWRVERCTCGDSICDSWDVVSPYCVGGKFAEADARLIAAAPELLKALEALADVVTPNDEPIPRALEAHFFEPIAAARAAIAKATAD